MADENDLSPARIRRLRNLKIYAGKTDEEIKTMLANKKPKVISVPRIAIKSDKEVEYNRRYDEMMLTFQTEFAVDMNDSNDRLALENLVRHQLQLEDIDAHIRQEMSTGYDSRQLKNWGDVQRSLITSISELQEKLGISRKQRKEKQSDSVAEFISSVRIKAIDFWERKTVKITCPKCEIELARYWLNFAELASVIRFELECWKCKEKIIYIK